MAIDAANGAEPCCAARRDHQHDSIAADETGPAEQRVRRVGGSAARGRFRPLLDGQVRLSGRIRFGERSATGEHDAVSRYEFTGLDFNHVARDDVSDRQLNDVIIARTAPCTATDS